MKKIIILFIIINTLLIYADSSSRWITSEAGLRMREAPGTKSKKIITIPYEEEVIFIEELNKEITISGAIGKWTKVKWKRKNITGWVFGGFLTEICPYSLDLTEQDIIGTWRDEGGEGYVFESESVIVDEPMGGSGTWSLDDNYIYIEVNCESQDPGNGRPINLVYALHIEILEYDLNYIKVNITNESGFSYERELYRE